LATHISAIHLVVTVADFQIHRIPAFIAHYEAMGVTQFWLTIHCEKTPDQITDLQLCAAAEPFLRGKPVELAVLRGSHDAMLVRSHHDALTERVIGPGIWIVWADIDEFQVYPRDLHAVLARADQTGATYISGELIDRVASNGELPPLHPDTDLWTQFPVGCSLTSTIMGGYTHKVTASKSHLGICHGNHEPLTLVPSNHWASDLVAIHHFKWDATVVPRLERRLLPDWKDRCPWWVETERALNFLNGRSMVDLSILDTFTFANGRHLPSDTAAWQFVRKQRMANPVWQRKWEAVFAEA
jgi:hypothetical protein